MRGTGTMALGTVVSRITGFVRTAVLVAVLGVKGVAIAFNVANTAPNIVFELLLGGVLASTIVPLLVRAERDGYGDVFVQRLLTLGVLVLGGTAIVLMIAAPLVVDLYANGKVSDEDRHLAVLFARFFLPQVLFYGLGAVLSAWLNANGRFGPPMWAPVLNNLVVIVTGLVFALLPGSSPLTSAGITQAQIAVLGIGVTAGVIAQTVALLPAVRATGLILRPRFGFRGSGLGQAAQLAKWTLAYVLCNQLVLIVVVQLATGTGHERDYPSYLYAFLLWQVPYAVVAVSVFTALLPTMSRAAAADDLEGLRTQLDRGLRSTIAVVMPLAVALLVLGRPLAAAVFGHGETSVEDARFIGTILGVFACGLVAFSAYQLQLRAFYAMQDTRTPVLINLSVNGTNLAVGVVLYLALPSEHKILGLAAGQAAAYLVGVLVCARAVARRVPTDPEGHVLRTAVRCVCAVSVPAVAALLLTGVVTDGAGNGTSGSLLAVAASGSVLVAGYALITRRLRVPEVDEVLAPLLRMAQGRQLPGRTLKGD